MLNIKWNLFLGGNIGILSSIFSLKPAVGPPKPWETPMSYPAINGSTYLVNNVYTNFSEACPGKRDYLWMTAPGYGDIFHPTEFAQSDCENVESSSKVSKMSIETSLTVF